MRLIMMGTGSFAQPTFEALLRGSHQVVGLVTQPDRAVGQQRGSTRLAERGMKELALEKKIEVLQHQSINTPEGVASLQALRPELLVVAAYGQILSRDVLATAVHGGINVHASLLPKYRGAAPIAWAIYHGETQTGVTIIRMSIHLDAGDILAQEMIDILPDETAGELETRLAPVGARLAMETIERVASGPVPGLLQDKSLATKMPKLTKEHGLIDWSRSAQQVCNHIRAMQPWPTSYTYLHRAGQPPQRLIVCRARVADNVVLGAELSMGRVVATERAGLFVTSGSATSVEMLEIQPAGKRRMSAADFLRGCLLEEGDYFGLEKP